MCCLSVRCVATPGARFTTVVVDLRLAKFTGCRTLRLRAYRFATHTLVAGAQPLPARRRRNDRLLHPLLPSSTVCPHPRRELGCRDGLRLLWQEVCRRGAHGPRGAHTLPRGVQKAAKSVKEALRRRKGRVSLVLQLKMGAQRHPKGAQGVQNEPRGIPEASRRRPRVSKKRSGGAKLDLVVFYRLFNAAVD